VPIFFGDVPKRDESLPKFLDDGDYAKFMRALAEEPVLHRRLGVDMLARTGMRVGELCDLEADAVSIMDGEAWLRIPVGKLHNDRFIPLHPHLVELIAEYQAVGVVLQSRFNRRSVRFCGHLDIETAE
jgi:integrase